MRAKVIAWTLRMAGMAEMAFYRGKGEKQALDFDSKAVSGKGEYKGKGYPAFFKVF